MVTPMTADAGEVDERVLARLTERLWPICSVLETASNYMAAVKAGCEIIGEPAGPTRKPILPLADAALARLRTLLEADRKEV
jgi:dihydrodipicolinate synthase/N-acetylneuraminate lyase